MTAPITTLDAPTASMANETTVSLRGRSIHPALGGANGTFARIEAARGPFAPMPAPVPPGCPLRGYPEPRAYRVPPLRHPHVPAGAAGFGVPWGPPSGPMPVARRPVNAPVPGAPARRRPGTALVMAALVFVLLVGGGVAAYVGFSVGPAYSTGATSSDATPTGATPTGATVGQ